MFLSFFLLVMGLKKNISSLHYYIVTLIGQNGRTNLSHQYDYEAYIFFVVTLVVWQSGMARNPSSKVVILIKSICNQTAKKLDSKMCHVMGALCSAMKILCISCVNLSILKLWGCLLTCLFVGVNLLNYWSDFEYTVTDIKLHYSRVT